MSNVRSQQLAKNYKLTQEKAEDILNAVRNYKASAIDECGAIEAGKFKHVLIFSKQCDEEDVQQRNSHMVNKMLSLINMLCEIYPIQDSASHEFKNGFRLFTGNLWYTYKIQPGSPNVHQALPKANVGTIAVFGPSAYYLVKAMENDMNLQRLIQPSSSAQPEAQSSNKSAGTNTTVIQSKLALSSSASVTTTATFVSNKRSSKFTDEQRAKRPLILAGMQALQKQYEEEARAHAQATAALELNTYKLTR